MKYEPVKDLTERKRILALIERCEKEQAMNKQHMATYINALENRIRELEADRPQGKWIRGKYWSLGEGMEEEYGFTYKCSLCEYEVANGYTRCSFNFCPYCGAQMKGTGDE